jgi:hypothetical protein
VGQRQGRPHGFDTQRLPVPLEEVTPAMPQIPAAKRDRDMHQAHRIAVLVGLGSCYAGNGYG